MDDVTIIVGTFGTEGWRQLGLATTAQHAAAGADRIVAVHGDTLAAARNIGAGQATTEWLCFLDAGDRLGHILPSRAVMAGGYFDAMDRSDADLRAPRLYLAHSDDHIESPDLTGRDIMRINPCPIGTLIRREMFFDVGGFWEEPAWEDWSLFRRCYLAGASIGHVADAAYYAPVDPRGRNSTVANGADLHRSIIRSHDAWLRGRAA